MAEAGRKERARRVAELQTVAEIMTFAIAREKASADYYEKALSKATTAETRKAFSLLLEQEREHERRLRDELEAVKQEIDRSGRK